ncbi:site-specific tyrosine recombinase [Lacunimicrobium album]
MPPRRRPVSDSPAMPRGEEAQGDSLQNFVFYLERECGMSGNTVSAYRTDTKRFLGWHRQNKLGLFSQLPLSAFRDYLKHLHEQNFATTTIARHLVSLKMFFRYLVLEGQLTESIVDLLNSPKLWQYLPKVLSPEKVDELLSAPGPTDRFPLRDRALLCLLYATGCRASEVSSLNLNSISLEEGFCRVIGKGDKERLVSLNGVARAALEAYLEHERPLLTTKAGSEVLLVNRSGRGLSRIVIWKLVTKYAQRIGCGEGVSPHTLRHSFATHMLAGGAEIRALQELMGHASIRTTQIYTHVENSRLKAIHKKFHPRG